MIPRCVKVLFVLVFVSACAEPGDRDFAFRPLWKYSFKGRFAKMMCAEDAYFRSCMPSTEDECRTALKTTLFDHCYEQEGEEVPFIISLPSEGQHWGSILGRCMGEQYYETFKDRLDEDSEACRRQAAALGLTPAERPLDRFYRLNPSAKVIAEHRPNSVELFERIVSAFEEQDEERGAKLYGEYKLLEAKLLASTSDEGIIGLYQNSTAQKKELLAISPELCSKVYFERAKLSDKEQELVAKSEQPKLEEEAEALTLRAVEAAVTSPGVRDDEAAEPILERALSDLPELEGCAAAIAMSERLLALPEDEAGLCLRSIHFESLRQTFGEARLAEVGRVRPEEAAQEKSAQGEMPGLPEESSEN